MISPLNTETSATVHSAVLQHRITEWTLMLTSIRNDLLQLCRQCLHTYCTCYR